MMIGKDLNYILNQQALKYSTRNYLKVIKVMNKRKRYEPEFKFKVALDAVKCKQRVSNLVTKYEIHPWQIYQWRQVLLDRGHETFDRTHQGNERNSSIDKKLQKLELELQWLKSKILLNDELIPRKIRRELIEQHNSSISISRQCELLGVNRSSIYYKSATDTEE